MYLNRLENKLYQRKPEKKNKKNKMNTGIKYIISSRTQKLHKKRKEPQNTTGKITQQQNKSTVIQQIRS